MPISPSNGASSSFCSITAVSRATWARSLVGLGLGGVDIGVGRDAALAQHLGAAQLGLGELQRGLGGGEVGALDPVVDLHQALAARHLVVGLEVDRLRRPRRPRPRGRRPTTARAVPIASSPGPPGDRLRLHHRDGDRRRLHGGEVLPDHLVAEQVEPDDAADDEGEQHDGEDQPLDHLCASSAPVRARRPIRGRLRD